jgi:hypothetical protein
MQKIFLCLIFFTTNVLAQSQLLKPVVCMETQLLLKALIEQGQEIPKWIGQGDAGDTSQTTILINEKTKTWTIVQFENENACVLGSGINGREIFTGPKI